MSFISTHLAETLMVTGLLLLIVEMLVLGFSTFILLFLGLSFLLTGMAMSVNLMPATTTSALWSNALVTAVLAALLWQPLKRLQHKQHTPNEVKSDFIGHRFVLSQDVDIQGDSRYVYSGIEWQLKSHTPIAKGTQVQVSKADVGVLWITAEIQPTSDKT